MKANDDLEKYFHYPDSRFNKEVAELLIKAGANVNKANTDRETLLKLARNNNHQGVISLFLMHGGRK